MIKLADNINTVVKRSASGEVDYPNRFMSGAVTGGVGGGLYGGALGGLVGALSDGGGGPGALTGAGIGALAGVLGGAPTGGLLNMLNGYSNADIVENAEEPDRGRRALDGALTGLVASPGLGPIGAAVGDSVGGSLGAGIGGGIGVLAGPALGALTNAYLVPWLNADMFGKPGK